MLELKVWGDYACFTSHEVRPERVSYPVMTPSAARGVLESVFWKPEMAWRIREIHVLKPINRISFVRNEINDRQSYDSATDWARTGRGGYDVADERHRAQRHTLALRDVAYLIRADIVLRDAHSNVAKYRDQFQRRVERGQCFTRPYLGQREFTAFFSAPTGLERPIDRSQDLGRMLFDLDFSRGEPIFFDAKLLNGVLHVPLELYSRQGGKRAA